MRHEIRFDGELSGDTLRQILADDFNIAGDQVYVGPRRVPPRGGRTSVAIVSPPQRPLGFGWTLIGDKDLYQAYGLTELELARDLSPPLRPRGLVDDETADPDRWIMVATDGSPGPVITDEELSEDGCLRVTHALETIPGAPELPIFHEFQ
jgi:hypothetical protein